MRAAARSSDSIRDVADQKKLRVLVYSDDVNTRQQVILALGRRVHPDAMAALAGYAWPGNVRELANVLERAEILAEGDVITTDDLPEAMLMAPQPGGDPADSGSLDLGVLERRAVAAALEQSKGNKAHAAKALGVTRRTLYRLIEKHRLEPPAEGGGDH